MRFAAWFDSLIGRSQKAIKRRREVELDWVIIYAFAVEQTPTLSSLTFLLHFTVLDVKDTFVNPTHFLLRRWYFTQQPLPVPVPRKHWITLNYIGSLGYQVSQSKAQLCSAQALRPYSDQVPSPSLVGLAAPSHDGPNPFIHLWT